MSEMNQQNYDNAVKTRLNINIFISIFMASLVVAPFTKEIGHLDLYCSPGHVSFPIIKLLLKIYM